MTKRSRVVRVDRLDNLEPALIAMTEEAEELAIVNAELVIADCASEDDIIEAVKDADAVLTAAAKITRHIMGAMPKCKVIVRYGVGFDNVDIAAATDYHILVVNIPDFCLEEVSNHAITLLLACAKKLVLLNDNLKQGYWAKCKRTLSPMGSIYGQTLGIVGCGRIGRLTAIKAQCFDLKVLGYDPYVTNSQVKACGICLVSLPDLLKASDFISLHVPLNKETWHLMGDKEFKQMKPNTYFVNTSRGAVVDEVALIKALEDKWIAGAGLDVFEKEPVNPKSPLFSMENVLVTPHSASYCDASFERLKRRVGQEAARVLSGRWPENVVNSKGGLSSGRSGKVPMIA
jgi:D-3-phosphoglycerate dehydrogenase